MRVPLATYRLQFGPGFGFRDAERIVPYLAELGISDIYASPIFRARSGSPHGYDVADHSRLNPDLGSEKDFDSLLRSVKEHGMGWLQDIVPNHMSYSHENEALMDVLENGDESKYLQFFDVDWEHPIMDGRLLAPFLGEHYGTALEKGEIALEFGEGGLAVRYHDLRLPLRTKSLIELLGRLGEVNSALSGLVKDAEDMGKDLFNRALWELYCRDSSVQKLVDSAVNELNGSAGVPESFDSLDTLLSEQRFLLSFWKTSSEEINYRRFFAVNELICLQAERKEVFEHVHSLIFDLVERGVTGLRIDHIDGLKEPENYLSRLFERLGEVYLVVEKILQPEEELSAAWPVQGTTGYDFLNCINGVLCQKDHSGDFEEIYSDFTELKLPYGETIYKKKKMIAERYMNGDVDNLIRLLRRVSDGDRRGRDMAFSRLRRALVEFLALFPVYRTYSRAGFLGQADEAIIADTLKKAGDLNPDLLEEFLFMERYLLQPGEFLLRLQQFTGPLMAKGFEDTFLYNYNRLIALNEVGGSPDRFGVSPEEFHAFNERRAKSWPHSMNATSTHDVKRGEDARARINVLSEIPEEWRSAVNSWSSINRSKKRIVKGRLAPERDDEYFLYQVLLGSMPFSEEECPSFEKRAKNYLRKAVREAGIHSAWTLPDLIYEEALTAFCEDILRSSEDNRFPEAFMALLRKVEHHGILNSLSQTLLKIASPGVPDFYQGAELWDLSFVDPDNRRPVDFERRSSYLKEIVDRESTDLQELIAELLEGARDGRVKLFLIHRALKARRKEEALFRDGIYIPLNVRGELEDHLIAFARRHKGRWALAVVPRLTAALARENEHPLGGAWMDTTVLLPPGAPQLWRDAVTDRMINAGVEMKAAQVLDIFPVALLLGEV